MTTPVLSRSDVIDSLDPDVLRSDLRRAFEAYSQNREIPARRVGSELPTAGSAMVLVSGLAAGIPAYSVKVHAKFPEASPSIRGLVLLFDAEDGALLSTMDSTYLTAARTGMTGALATDVLARDDATTMAVVGAGTQGEFGLRHLARSRSLEGVSVYDASLERAVAFAERMTNELGVSVDVHETVQEAVADRRIVLTATWSDEPFLDASVLRPETHVTALGSDGPGKRELSADLIEHAWLVRDDRELVRESGAIANADLDGGAIDAELGAVVVRERPGRTTDEEITVFAPVGLAFQDLVVHGRSIAQHGKRTGKRPSTSLGED